MKKRRTQITPEDLLPFDSLKALYDQHYATTKCRACAADKTRTDVLKILENALLACCPNVFDLCQKHRPPAEPSPETRPDDNDDDLPI